MVRQRPGDVGRRAAQEQQRRLLPQHLRQLLRKRRLHLVQLYIFRVRLFADEAIEAYFRSPRPMPREQAAPACCPSASASSCVKGQFI